MGRVTDPAGSIQVRKRVGVLVSGNGSNLQALIDATSDPSFPARIVVVVANRPGVRALDRARAAGIATRVVPHHAYPDRERFDAELHRSLIEAGCQIVCLAGFMRILTGGFVNAWQGRMLNIHPSLLPEFRGLDTHGRALRAGRRVAGCTVHFVSPALDSGAVILQARVPVLDGDTPERLAARVLEQEHRIYPLALRLLAEGRICLVDGKLAGDTDVANFQLGEVENAGL